MSKDRYLRVTVEKAREWLYGNNQELRELALNLFDRKELEKEVDPMSKIESLVKKAKIESLSVPISDERKFKCLANLSIISNYLNDGWKKEFGITGYFIDLEKDHHIMIRNHTLVRYPGIIYFKTEEKALEAVRIIGEQNLKKSLS